MGFQGVQQPPAQTGRREKQEKQEKHEKREKGEKSGSDFGGILVGGSILIWLGVTFFLQENGQLPSDKWWAYFLVGVGIILVATGLIRYSQGHRAFFGQIIGGAFAIAIGLTSIQGEFRTYWPLLLVILGVGIIVMGYLARRKSPKP